jgi:hypothetical protein
MKSTLEQSGVFTPFRQYENFKRVYISEMQIFKTKGRGKGYLSSAKLQITQLYEAAL